MKPLAKEVRNKLESTVKDARDIAEAAAAEALSWLGVDSPKAPKHLNEEQIKTRNAIRAHGRQLGDRRDESGKQETKHLVSEVAYEHWHRMLFARFLAENQLLMHPDGVALTLDECEELARSEGRANGWELAGEYASRMLPQIFRPNNPVLALKLSPNRQRELEKLLAGLNSEVFQAFDSLGWVYQFWQGKKNEEINKSEVKIGADELPAVTQRFTEHYMVEFLLHNSLGAWWIANFPDKSCPVELTYLRYVPEIQGEQAPTTKEPAAGTFPAWPKSLKEFKLLDPCCGSGHFLVSAFLMLVPMRMALEKLTPVEAVTAVLRDNLFGLEIDTRCIEIAAFNLALNAWRYTGAGGYRRLPELNLACTGLAISQKEADWIKLANGNEQLKNGMKLLFGAFKDAPLLGSLLDPARAVKADFFTSGVAELRPLLDKALACEHLSRLKTKSDEEELVESGITAKGLLLAAELLSEKYDLVITNVPYLARGGQCEHLKTFCEEQYPKAKNDLANVFLERCLEFCKPGGVTQIVMPQNWLFLGSYKKQREHLLREETWNLLARLGSGAFETISGEVVKVILLVLTHTLPSAGQKLCGLDAGGQPTAQEKAYVLKAEKISVVGQSEQLNNPDSIIALEVVSGTNLLSAYASINYGSKPGQTDRVIRVFWEQDRLSHRWQLLESTPNGKNIFSGKEKICLSLSEVEIQRINEFGIRSANVWGKRGIVLSQMKNMAYALYLGKIFDNNTSVIVPNNDNYLVQILAFLESGKYLQNVRKINQKLDVAAHTMVKVPFELDHWTKIAAERYPNGLPKPYSNDPTQWIFHGHPAQSDAPLQVAIARLLGYTWPAESDNRMELSDEARIFIKKASSLNHLSEDDGIVCLPVVRGKLPATEHLLKMLEAAFGKEWSAAKLGELLKNADSDGKTLEWWLRERFFDQHCRLFHQRPFIWQIWDGQKDGFSVLVNYHKLTQKNLERLIYTYLGDWISAQEKQVGTKVDGADIRLAAAQELKTKLEAILEGESPYDIFVRWKPIEEQPVGWNPDLNDGVRLNIRPFATAGVLRYSKPPKLNIKWDKDRGTDVESSPWFSIFKGERRNDYHLSLKEKNAARSKRAAKKA